MSSSVFSPAGFSARRRAPQRQQQPERFALNLQQQQQGSSEYQHGQGLRADPAEAEGLLATPRPPRAGNGSPVASNGGNGGTPVHLPDSSTRSPAELKSYIREASANVDA